LLAKRRVSVHRFINKDAPPLAEPFSGRFEAQLLLVVAHEV